MASKIKKGDTVVVLTGRSKGIKGEVLKIIKAENLAIVAGVNMVKRHTRATQSSEGGIIEKESSIHLSNIAHIDPKDDKPTRVSFKEIDGRKVRVSARSGESLD
ncbi:MAG: 50S ribosomal protein L24 [Magnetovibrio sp.]|nr:50S ribosomal protein L24 [Magnetovibrio sp.]